MKPNSRIRLAPLLGLAILVGGGCASSPDGGAAGPLVGCWYFERGETAESLRLPWGVELTDRPLQGWPAVQQLEGVREAGTLTPSGIRDFPFAYWRRHAGGDSVHIGHPGGTGFAADLELVPAPDDRLALEGTIRPVGDVVRPGGLPGAPESRPVRLTRAACPELGRSAAEPPA